MDPGMRPLGGGGAPPPFGGGPGGPPGYPPQYGGPGAPPGYRPGPPGGLKMQQAQHQTGLSPALLAVRGARARARLRA